MSALLDRLSHARMTRAQADDTARKIKVVEAATFTSRSLVYYERIEELPDHVKNHPPRAQRAFLHTYNNVLKRRGDYGMAMRAADKALRSTALKLKTQKRPATPAFDEDLVHYHAKRMLQGPRVQVVTS